MDVSDRFGAREQRVQLGGHRIGFGWSIFLVEASKEVQQPCGAGRLHHVSGNATVEHFLEIR